MTVLYGNFLKGTITDDPLSDSATTINSSAFDDLPEVADPDIMWITLDPDGSSGAPEVVKVTAHGASATSVTVVRGQQGSTAREHADGTAWANSLTKSDADGFSTGQFAQVQADEPTLTDGAVQWDYENHDADDWVDINTSDTRVTPTRAGWYLVSLWVDILESLGTGTDTVTFSVVKNSATTVAQTSTSGASNDLNATGVVYLDGDDYLEVNLSTNHDELDCNDVWFNVVLLKAA